MTPEEAKKLVAGDVVLVRAVVERIGESDLVILNTLVGRAPVALDSIHSVLPRPLAVGDRVNTSLGAETGQIVAIMREEACVDVGADDGGLIVFDLADLERAT